MISLWYWKGIRNKDNHEKNTNIAFSKTEVGKRLQITAAFPPPPQCDQITGGAKGIFNALLPEWWPIYCALLCPRQAALNNVFSFSCMVLGNVINNIQTVSLLLLFTAFFPPKWNTKFCYLGVVTIITAADIANDRNRTGSRKMWPKVHDFSSSCDC